MAGPGETATTGLVTRLASRRGNVTVALVSFIEATPEDISALPVRVTWCSGPTQCTSSWQFRAGGSRGGGLGDSTAGTTLWYPKACWAMIRG